MSAPKTPPKAPPVYRPQPTPKVLQRKAAPTPPQAVAGARQTPAAPPVYRPQPTAPAAAVQAKQAGQNAVQPKMGANVVQLKKACNLCGHKHGATDCTTQIWIDDTNHSLGKKACGCKSHSSKHDSGAKFNHGSGRRARRLEGLNMA